MTEGLRASGDQRGFRFTSPAGVRRAARGATSLPHPRHPGPEAGNASLDTLSEPEIAERLATALRGLTLPAERWQVVTHADLAGADAVIRAALAALPAERYRTAVHLTRAVASWARRAG